MRSTTGCSSGESHSLRFVFTVMMVLLLAALGTFTPGPALAQATSPTYVSPPATPLQLPVDLSKLPVSPPVPLPERPLGVIPGPVGPSHPPGPPDPIRQMIGGPTSDIGGLSVTPEQFTTPNPNFPGMNNGGFPPDTNGAPGPNHYIQTINVWYQIWDKNGNSLAGPNRIQNLWNLAGAPTTNQCRTEFYATDPYVQYDHLADRWVISFLASANSSGSLSNIHYICFAVSQGPNPVTSGWYLYNFDITVPGDYPKFGVWPDGYYMITQEGYNGGNLDATVFDRANMLNGNPATFQRKSFFAFPGFGGETVIALPSELTGPPPPAGSPNFYVRPIDGDLYSDGGDRIEIWEFHTDWGNPANTSITATQTLTPAGFTTSCNASGDDSLDQDCIPQPGTSNLLDGQTIWPRSPLQYRNFGDHETLVFAHGVNVNDAQPGLVGTRWYELRRAPAGSGSWVIQQQGTFEPTDVPNSDTTTIHRWNASIAMDSAGNMAMGYNVSNDGSNGNVYPGIRYVGRLATDPLGEMTTQEVTLATGDGTIISSGDRWGDYSAMRVDPVDGCTFWYTAEYLSGGGQASRIGAFRFPTCDPANLSISKSGTPDPVIAGNQLTYTISVTNKGPANATNVIVTDTLPTGVTVLSTSADCTAGTVQTGCNVGSLANGASISFTIQVRVNANLLSSISASTTNIKNTAIVSADQLDPDTSDNSVTIATNVIESADLQLTKQCKPDETAPTGTTATCTIFVDNLGSSDARDVVVTDTNLSNGSFVISSATFNPPPNSPCVIAGGVVTCNLGVEPAGGKTTITVQVTSNDPVDVNDTATVKSATPDPNTANNTATGKVRFVGTADLSLAKSGSPDPVIAGQNLTYTLTATNQGPSSAPNVVVTDVLPKEVSLVSAAPAQGSCGGTTVPGDPAQPLTCNLGALASGASAQITVVVNVHQDVPSGTILVNNATVSSDYADPNNGDNNATATVTVNTSADLEIVKTADNDVYKPSSLITYTVNVTNNGSSDARQVVVTDYLPDLKQAIYQSDNGGCAKDATTPTRLTCDMGYIPAGEFRRFQVYVLVHGSRGQVSNTATVASSDSDPVPGNNSSTIAVVVGK